MVAMAAIFSCRSRVDYEDLTLKAKQSPIGESDMFYQYQMIDDNVVQSVCLGEEFRTKETTCDQRKVELNYKKLRQFHIFKNNFQK